MYNEIKLKSNKVKASYFYSKRLKAHIKVRPVGAFDAVFESDIIDDTFYWIKKLDSEKQEMLFVVDIFDIKPYEERVQ